MKDVFLIFVIISILLTFSIYHPIADFAANPPFWGDESVGVEKARNFLQYRTLDIAIAPGVISGKPYATAAAGPFLTLPLTAFFYFFGIGIFQARVFMVLWLAVLATTIYLMVKVFFNRTAGVAAALLVVTFSPFYANGKTVTGDIPGFFLLLAALYFLYWKKNMFWGGLLIALAVTTKPSLYLSLPLVAVLEFFYSDGRTAGGKVLIFMLGGLLIIMPWVISLMPDSSSLASWRTAYEFFHNPFPAASKTTLGLLLGNEPQLVLNSTLLHYIVLILVAVLCFFKTKEKNTASVHLIRFSVIYALAAFFLYLRSPGWLRYLIAGELLLFMIFLPSLRYLMDRRFVVAGMVASLIFMQGIHFLFFSWRSASWAVGINAAALNAMVGPDETIGFVNDLPTASLIDSNKKFQVVRISGNTVLGISPLAYDAGKLPTYILLSKKQREGEFVKPFEEMLLRNYRQIPAPHQNSLLYKKL